MKAQEFATIAVMMNGSDPAREELLRQFRELLEAADHELGSLTKSVVELDRFLSMARRLGILSEEAPDFPHSQRGPGFWDGGKLDFLQTRNTKLRADIQDIRTNLLRFPNEESRPGSATLADKRLPRSE